MRIASIALLKLSINLIIRRDSALKYSYYTRVHKTTTWPGRTAFVTLMSLNKELLIRYQCSMDLCIIIRTRVYLSAYNLFCVPNG